MPIGEGVNEVVNKAVNGWVNTVVKTRRAPEGVRSKFSESACAECEAFSPKIGPDPNVFVSTHSARST